MREIWADKYIKWAERLLPSPFAIAILLTAVAFIGSIWHIPEKGWTSISRTAEFWELGVWDLLKFGMQMMFMLVIGYAVALSKAVQTLIDALTNLVKSNVSAVLVVLIFSLLMGYINWGLGLVFGSILARRVGIHAAKNNINVNYPLIGAAAYTSLMVWHGGLSGSAPLTVAKAGHNLEAEIGVIPISETIYSTTNFISVSLIFLLLPILAFALAKLAQGRSARLPVIIDLPTKKKDRQIIGAEHLDFMRWFSMAAGLFILFVLGIKVIQLGSLGAYINLDSINLFLLALALLLHKNLRELMDAVGTAMKSSAGILLQFPLYAGIMGIMKYAGLIDAVAESMTELASTTTFPLMAFASSAIVNVLVPSGGAQWQVQGPVLIQAAQTLGYSTPKTILALAYGDQITNMLQPFWALPLLGITGLKAKQILPYSLLFMILGSLIYIVAIYIS